MIPTMRPYTPSLYQPDSFGRYRKYPRVVHNNYPGTGYKVGPLEWKEQVLNLDGNVGPQPYGNYSSGVPLRGMGASFSTLTPTQTAAIRGAIRAKGITLQAPQGSSTRAPLPPPPTPPSDNEVIVDSGSETTMPAEYTPDSGASYDTETEIMRAASEALAPPLLPAEEGFFDKKIGPVPLWLAGLGGVALLGGGAWWFTKRKGVKANRRRR